MTKIHEDFTLMLRVQGMAKSIDHTVTCLTAIPGYEDNKSIIDSYKDRLVDQCKAMAAILEEVK